MKRIASSITATAVLLVSGGCGGGSRPSVQGARADASLPKCVHAGAAVARPDGFPDSLPLPDGTLLTKRETGVKRAAVAGFVPMPLRDAAAWLARELPAAGYQPGEGDAEQDEAESLFAGHGYRGKWKLNALDGCPGAVAVQVSLSPTD